MTDKIVVFSTCESEEAGIRIARKLVDSRLAACATLLPGGRSIYRWQGEIQDEQECLLIIKSSRPLWEALRTEIARLHSYTVPEIIALPVVEGSPSYMQWLEHELQPPPAA